MSALRARFGYISLGQIPIMVLCNYRNQRHPILRIILSGCIISRKHWWFSGRILACHAGGPGSIPGQCTPTSCSFPFDTLQPLLTFNFQSTKAFHQRINPPSDTQSYQFSFFFVFFFYCKIAVLTTGDQILWNSLTH